MLCLKGCCTEVMVREQLLHSSTSLTSEEWIVVEDICAILASFKYVQKVMEREKYVTISLIPGIISSIFFTIVCLTKLRA